MRPSTAFLLVAFAACGADEDSEPSQPPVSEANGGESNANESSASGAGAAAGEPSANEAVGEDEAVEAEGEGAPWRGDEGAVRLVVESDHELLRSEQAVIRRLRSNLEEAQLQIVQSDAEEDHRAVLEAWAAGGEATVPAAWRGEGQVIAVSFHPTLEERGRNYSRGPRSFAVLRAPDSSPVYAERIDVGMPYYRAQLAVRETAFLVRALQSERAQ
ncbi:MAG: hypothetical protein AAF938_17765 [Myxococcota bacterium]